MTFVGASALLAFPDRDDANNAPVVDSLTPILADSAVVSYGSWWKTSSPCAR